MGFSLLIKKNMKKKTALQVIYSGGFEPITNEFVNHQTVRKLTTPLLTL
jgi:hypothetical protein